MRVKGCGCCESEGLRKLCTVCILENNDLMVRKPKGAEE